MNEQKPVIEKKDGKTPNGGVRSESYFMDDNKNPAPKDTATFVEVVELNEEGSIVFRSYMRSPPDEQE